MYSVYWSTGGDLECLYTNPDYKATKQWALDHISYTGHLVLRVEIHDNEGCIDIIFNKNWPIV